MHLTAAGENRSRGISAVQTKPPLPYLFLVSYEGDGLQASQGFFFCQSFCVSSHLSCDCVFFLALQCFSDEPDNRGDVGLMCSRRQQMWRISFLSRVVCKMLRRTAGYRITSFFCFSFEHCENNLMQPAFDSCCRDWITELRWVFLECKQVESKAKGDFVLFDIRLVIILNQTVHVTERFLCIKRVESRLYSWI